MSHDFKVTNHAAVYIDRAGTCAIIVPMHYNGRGGFLFEDNEPQVLRPLPGAEPLGIAVLSTLERSQVRPETSHRDRKRTDWPAFKASGVRSVQQFEAEFIHIHIAGANEANVIYEIEGLPEKDAELRVLSTANPRPPDQLGKSCLAVWRACRDRQV